MKNASHTPRRLKIDLADLADAFNNAGYEMRYFLDQETGAVILLTKDAREEFAQLSEDLGARGDPGWAAAFEAAMAEAGVPDWQVESVRDASRIEADAARRYLNVPEADSREGYRDMEAFIETVGNPRVAERLARAIGGRGAFRAFKDELLDHPAERERWFAFRERQRVLAWLAAEGIEPE